MGFRSSWFTHSNGNGSGDGGIGCVFSRHQFCALEEEQEREKVGGRCHVYECGWLVGVPPAVCEWAGQTHWAVVYGSR